MESNPSLFQNVAPYNHNLHLLIQKLSERITIGQHKGKRRGIGTEFSEYRAYQPGDDVRLIDWKMYGRSDRFYLRESETEASFTFRFFLDHSASMDIREQGYSKKEWSLLILYILSSIGFQQRDTLHFHYLSGIDNYQWKPHQGKSGYIATLTNFSTYSSVQHLSLEEMYQISKSISSHKTEWWIILSDFIQVKDELLQWISSITHPKRMITCFRIKTPNEHRLSPNARRLQDIELEEEIWVKPNDSTQKFTRNYEQYFQALSGEIKSFGVEWVEGDTHSVPVRFIEMWLKHRNRRVAQ